MTAGAMPRKNMELFIQAFHQEFGNTSKVALKIHSRLGVPGYIKKIDSLIEQLKSPNILFLKGPLPNEQYLQFFKSLDCYVILSKGEGFSVTPRESLALGLPCIISNNTAHKTICKSGHVYAVPSETEEPADCRWNHGKYLGKEFNCTISDVRKALREVYNNYEHYQEKAQNGRKWVEQYLWKNLKKRWLNIIKPKNIKLGNENKVTDEYLMTTSASLYHKYNMLNSTNKQ